MIIKRQILLLFLISLLCRVYGQEYYDTICWVWVGDQNYQAVPGERISNNNELNTLFFQNNVVHYEKAYPFAKTPELLKIHEIRCTHNTSIDNVISLLTSRFGDVFYNFSKIEIIEDYPMDYDPIDWMWHETDSNYLWYLKKIQANLAWNITQGDTMVKTAVLDYFIDEEHPDLRTEIVASNYPYPEPPNIDTIFPALMNNPRLISHGTAVAAFVSAETTKPGEQSLGQLASVGFDTKIIPYYISSSRNDFLQKALHSSSVAGADIIVSCAGGALFCYPEPETGEELVMKEILNNGTVIVMPAGNGKNSTNRSYCGDDFHATEHYPFNSSYDERVIVVTSTDSLDYHRYINDGIDKTHSHFPTIDICAPGYHLMGAKHTHNTFNGWPYYGDNTGTSYAAPIVAGACSLLKSINKDFTPGEIQYFIKSTADPVMDEYDYHGMLGAGRLNVYRAVEMASNCSPGIISSNQTWNNDTIVVCSVDITQSGCLTINSQVKLSKHSKIIVHPGGKLIIDGGCLTSLDEIMWPGIEVWGNSSTHQHPVNGVYGQGYLEMKNGAVIENAVCAVNLWRPNYWNTTGGIVHANKAVFRNNAMAVHALDYTNYNPRNNQEEPYSAGFINCVFDVDSAYLGTTSFGKHVELYLVNGIAFKGCSFSVDPRASNVSSAANGILALDAGFSVWGYCLNNGGDMQSTTCPEEYQVRSTFIGFDDAIRVVGDGGSARTFSVSNSVFADNKRGVYARNTGYATILRNDFRIGTAGECSFGVYVDNVTGFCIEENAFTSSVSTSENYGIGVFNCPSNNDVYLNTFDGLDCGNLAVGVNTVLPSFPPGPPVDRTTGGLTYSCNQNTRNTFDFCVLKDGHDGGVKPNQGSATIPAGNTFSGSTYHFYNDGEDYINYFYDANGSGQTPASSLLYRVSRVSTTNSNGCQTHYGPVVRTQGELLDLERNFLTARGAYSSLLQIYGSRLDGGNTPAEVTDLLSSTPSDAQRLRTRLLGLSPYLSQEVLTAAAGRNDVFSDPVLFEILAANPDELKKDTLISYLEQKNPPLPGYIIGMLRQIASGTTPRTALVAQMAQYEHDGCLAAGDIIRSILNDSVADPQRLRTWLGNMGEIASDRMAIASYVQEGDFGHAFELANLLPDLYELEGDGLRDHSDYIRLLGLFRTLYVSGRTTAQLTDGERMMVDSIADWGIGFSRSMAEGIHESYSGEPRTNYLCPQLPEVEGSRGSTGIDGIVDDAAFAVSVSPNPAKSVVKIDYTLPEGATEAVLEMANILGVKVLSVALEGGSGSKEIKLGKLSSGIYNYTVRCGDNVINGKLVVAY